MEGEDFSLKHCSAALAIGHADVAEFFDMQRIVFKGLPSRGLSPMLTPLQGAAQLREGADHGNAHDFPLR